MNKLFGTGYFVWKAWLLPFFDDQAQFINQIIKPGNISNLWLKLTDGALEYHRTTGLQFKDICNAAGVDMHGWFYSYGNDPKAEAVAVASVCGKYGITELAIDVEAQWKNRSGSYAITLVNELRERLPNTRLWLCSYRYPSLHREIPWKEFMNKVDGYLPQVYWQESHNSHEQARKTVAEYRSLEKKYGISPKPMLLAGSAYEEWGWKPDLIDFPLFMTAIETLVEEDGNVFPSTLYWELLKAHEQDFIKPIGEYVWNHEPDPEPEPDPDPDLPPVNFTDPWEFAFDWAEWEIKGTVYESDVQIRKKQ